MEFEPIAVVGLSGVFPGSPDVDRFWEHLVAGHDLISEIPPDRFDWRAYYGDPLRSPNTMGTKWGGFMADVDKFDAPFFHISPREAELMDPQQRLFLEVVWRAIEDAAYRPSELAERRVGLFVGVSTSDYSELLARGRQPIDAYVSTGNAHSVLPNRISYLLNLRGPSEPVDTACSSALVALHRAVKSIHDGDCDMAIAGGVNVLLSPSAFIAFSQAGMLARDGRCKTFDKRADGYVRGEGCGAGPEAAGASRGRWRRDLRSDPRHGRQSRWPGQALTAPNPQAQAELLMAAYSRAGVGPETVGYIEAHGTGTELGDPIEVHGLKRAFAAMAERGGVELARGYCGLGTVKSNIGHLEAAAGVAGLVKVLLSLRHGILPASLHCRELNPYLQLEESPFYVVDSTRAWEPMVGPSGERLPRRAGISSFGFGGACARRAGGVHRPPWGGR